MRKQFQSLCRFRSILKPLKTPACSQLVCRDDKEAMEGRERGLHLGSDRDGPSTNEELVGLWEGWPNPSMGLVNARSSPLSRNVYA